MPQRLRVLLVEDDASLQRFVAMALEDEDVRLQGCLSVDEALLSLATQTFDLVITDLMMPGRSGHELLATLESRPALRGNAELAVFSAGLTPEVRARLADEGVTRFLSKPCSLAELHACVREVRDTRHAREARERQRADAVVAGEAAPAPSIHHAAVETYFGGNVTLYQAFLARCREQFPRDIAAGRLARDQGNFQSLRHLAHSLKSVLLTLGHPDAAEAARLLERDAQQAAADSATDADRDAARAGWAPLEAALSRLL